MKTVKLEEMEEKAQEVVQLLEVSPLILFIGNLGAGKTTLIKNTLKILGVEDHVQSPTFSIVNIYNAKDGREIYHFDCYRLKSQSEALDIGIEEYLDSGNICLIEWPELIEDLIAIPFWKISIEHNDAESRKISIKKVEL